MDKQKQMIKQLRKDLCNGYCGYETCGDCYGENDSYIGCTGMAERLYDAGYRKIPENAVVLKREEYDTLKAENDKYVKDCIDYLATINKLENKVWEIEQQSSKEITDKGVQNGD